jgi:hypothetical protein
MDLSVSLRFSRDDAFYSPLLEGGPQDGVFYYLAMVLLSTHHQL